MVEKKGSESSRFGNVKEFLSLLLIALFFFALVFTLLFGSFSSFGGGPSLIPDKYFMAFVIGSVILFSAIIFILALRMHQETSNPGLALNIEDYNGSNSLRVMATGATIASLTFTVYVVTGERLGLGFLRILIVPSLFSSTISGLAFIFRRYRSELLFTSLLLLLAVFIMFIFILPQFF